MFIHHVSNISSKISSAKGLSQMTKDKLVDCVIAWWRTLDEDDVEKVEKQVDSEHTDRQLNNQPTFPNTKMWLCPSAKLRLADGHSHNVLCYTFY